MAVAMMAIVIAATTGFMQSSKTFMQNQSRATEANVNARAAIDTLVRDIRLSGACLPVTGDFVALDGTNSGDLDHIWTRTGLVRADMSCVRAATTGNTPKSGTTVAVDDINGFAPGMWAYIRSVSGVGEFFTITSISSGAKTLGRSIVFNNTYPAGSGVYAVDDRHYFLMNRSSDGTPQLMQQVNGNPAQSFAVGMQKLNFQYQLRRNCPPCDVVDLPANEDEWRLVEQVYVSVSARSDKKMMNGQYLERVIEAAVKPRNLLPQ